MHDRTPHDRATHDRATRLAQIKRQIAAGEYETPEKLEAAVDAILDAHRDGALHGGDDLPPHRRRAK